MAQGDALEGRSVIEKQVGGTLIRIVPPALVSDEERQRRHNNIVQAVASCLRSGISK